MSASPYNNPMSLAVDNAFLTSPTTAPTSTATPAEPQPPAPEKPPEDPIPVVLPAATKTERFFLTAADQASGTRNERLNMVIRSKYEAGLLKPYNYVKGYARLSRWMDKKWVFSFLLRRQIDLSCTLRQRVPRIQGKDPTTALYPPAEVPSEHCLPS